MCNINSELFLSRFFITPKCIYVSIFSMNIY